ncbi:MAG: TauD/TfdA family dioxygenase [Dongiaceae bacterium]
MVAQAKRIVGVEVETPHLRVVWSDGSASRFHSIWLQENSSIAIEPNTGQREHEAFEYPLDLAVTSAELGATFVHMTFSNGTTSAVELTVLESSIAECSGFRSIEMTPQPWVAVTEIPEPFHFDDFAASSASRLEALRRLVRFGFVFIDNVPAIDGGLAQVIDRIGPIKQTNFGRIEDVKVALNPTDLTLTARGIEMHTDNPYRSPTPGYTVLHCLQNDVQGGESSLVDGLMAVSRLHSESPELLSAISKTSPRFRYEDSDTILEFSGPLVEWDANGALRQVRFSNRTEYVPALPVEELHQYYAGRQRFAAMLRSADLMKQFRFVPGLLLIMDNYRCLHGRMPYEANSGTRHLQLCFLDRDVVASRLRVLSRDHALLPHLQGPATTRAGGRVDGTS